MSSPKASLHLLYVNSQSQPRYETRPVLAAAAAQGALDNGQVVSAAFFIKPVSSQQHGFQCTLYLPDIPPVVSDVFAKKREAEQDAARKALEQMGKAFSSKVTEPNLSHDEKMDALADRIGALFHEKVVISCQPLKEHFRVAMKRTDSKSRMVPAAVLAALDNKISSICRSLCASSDCDPAFSVLMVLKAARRCPLVTCEEGLWIKRIEPFSSGFEEDFFRSETEVEVSFRFEAVYIPYSQKETVTSIEIKLGQYEYYLDALAGILGVRDGAAVMLSRTIARAPHGSRLYWPVSNKLQRTNTNPLHPFFNSSNNEDFSLEGKRFLEDTSGIELPMNKRASDLAGFSVYGNAILANVGSSWRTEGKLSCVDFSLCSYYRLMLGRTPVGNYKLSRDSILVATLPCSFSSRSQWRGKLPRSLLIDLCHQHRLPDPVFSFSCPFSVDEEKAGSGKNAYKCKVKVVFNDDTVEFESERLYRNQNDAVHSAALCALLFMSGKVGDLKDMPSETEVCDCHLPDTDGINGRGGVALAKGVTLRKGMLQSEKQTAEGIGSQICKSCIGETCPSKSIAAGSIVSIAYAVHLFGTGVDVELESHKRFEFEFGVRAIIGELENVIAGMCIGEQEQITLPIPSVEMILATNEEAARQCTESSIRNCMLRYDVTVIGSLEPPEERMESALFSPPLSKQRNEFAIHKIQEVHAKSLVDLGCGSGSLLDAVVDSSTELELVAGVDISLKSLLRAAKSLNSKLGSCPREGPSFRKLKQAVLYEGSLAEPDLRLCGFDIATCIEVVEHMDPEPLLKAGEVILGIYSPRILILSTPNIEYNVLLQKITADAKANNSGLLKSDPSSTTTETLATVRTMVVENHEKDSFECRFDNGTEDMVMNTNHLDDVQNSSLMDDDPGNQPIKLRNDDHRFEWTRAEFAKWGDDLALRFGYIVEYSGVGGSVEDPGFASQIAIFTRKTGASDAKLNADVEFNHNLECHALQNSGLTASYREIWKYNQDGVQLNMDLSCD